MSLVRTILKNMTSVSLMLLTVKLFALGVYVAVARQMGDAGFGRFSLLIAFGFLCTIPLELGINTYFVRAFARDRELIRKRLVDLLVMRVALFPLVAAAATAVLALLGKDQELIGAFYWFFGSFFFIVLTNVFRAAFDSQQKMEHFAALETLRQALTFLFVLLVLRADLGLRELGMAHCAAAGICVALWVPDFLWVFGKPHLRAYPGQWLETMRVSFPFLTITALGVVQSQLLVFLLSVLASDEAVAFFNKGFRLVYILYLVPTAILVSMFPVLIRLHVDEAKGGRFGLAAARIDKYLFAIGLPIVVGGVLLGGRILELIYGDEPANVVLVFRLLCVSILPVFMAAAGGVMLNAMNREWQSMRVLAVSSLTMLGLSLALIPLWREYGAAAANVMANGLMWALFFRARRAQGISRAFPVLKPLAAVGVMGAVVAFTPELPVALLIGLGAVVYLGCLFGLKYFDTLDREIARKILSGRSHSFPSSNPLTMD